MTEIELNKLEIEGENKETYFKIQTLLKTLLLKVNKRIFNQSKKFKEEFDLLEKEQAVKKNQREAFA